MTHMILAQRRATKTEIVNIISGKQPWMRLDEIERLMKVFKFWVLPNGELKSSRI